jgi:hypothetical protein
MKIFIATYEAFYSSPEKSIIIADDIVDAKKQVIESLADDEFKDEIEFVDKEPDQDARPYCFEPVKCYIEEVEEKTGFIYTGYHCC